ncbi:MAG: hypothetical protein H6828_00740 [Planctomycetes bacterium]|nr:hypothetical protein [Planctomycetota bacterium]
MTLPDDLLDELRALCAALRAAARGAVAAGHAAGNGYAAQRPTGVGAGDVTFALDEAAEAALEAWFERRAARGPLSVFSEDRGWRHRGPSGALAGFDHGGPRVVVDPVDGTRHLMADLRSAWTVVAACGPGAGVPRFADVELGLVAELPDSRAARYRVLRARRGAGARLELRALDDDALLDDAPLAVDADDRADHGYFSVFRYSPAARPALAQIEAAFFERLARHEGADPRSCYDDQYISNGGQLALLALGTYRLIADLRAWLAARGAPEVTTSKPYDCAGALLVAREAGCALSAPEGGPLDFPLDATTPVSFVGWANAATAARLAPHLQAALHVRV